MTGKTVVSRYMLMISSVADLFMFFPSDIFFTFFTGVHSGLVTHVPIPNTIDKEPSGDGTAYLTAGE